MSIFEKLLNHVEEAGWEYAYGNYTTWLMLMLECSLYCFISTLGFLIGGILCLVMIPIAPTISTVRWLRSLIHAKQQ